MVRKRAIVYGAGKIFDLHYSQLMASLYEEIVISDPYLTDLHLNKIKNKLYKIKPNLSLQFSQQQVIPFRDDHVFIFTPHKYHYQLIKENLKAARIYIEKPVVLESQNWNELELLSIKSGTVLWPAYHHFYTSLEDITHNSQLKTRVKDIKSIHIQFNRGPFPTRDWGNSFNSKLHAGGGALLDLGPHILSIIAILVEDITSHTIDFNQRKFLYNKEVSEVDTYVLFSGDIGSKINLEGEVGYGLHFYNKDRRIKINSLDGSDLEWNDGNLLMSGRPISENNPVSNLAFRNMLSDFYNEKKCPYIHKVKWIVKTLEDLYAGETSFRDNKD